MRTDRNDDFKFEFERDESFEDLSEFDLPLANDAPVAGVSAAQEPASEPAYVQPEVAPEDEVYEEMPEYGEEPAQPQPEPVQPVVQPSAGGVVIRGVTGAIDIRPNFEERLAELGDDIIGYHARLQAHLTSYRKVKSRYRARCDSYRSGRNRLAKMAGGGKTLKPHLAVDPEDQALASGKYHPRDLSNTSAYAEVPFMVPIRSDLAVRKAIRVIDYMMGNFQIPKRRKRRKNGSAQQK